MSDKSKTFQLPVAIYSPQSLETVTYEAEKYLEWAREALVHQKVGAASVPEPNFSAETVMVVESWLGGNKPTISSLEELVECLKNLQPPVIHVTLAALPSRPQRVQLIDWFRANISSAALVSFVADRSLGGGVIVRTPNHLYDYSWRAQLLAGRGRLAEIIHNV
jgi:hypothetical protein